MVLEGLAAVGLAANVVQFIDAGCKLFSKSHNLYKSASGVSIEDWELEQLARNLEELSLFAVTLPSRQDEDCLNKSDQSLKDIALACRDLATQLTGILKSLRIEDADKGSQRRWKAFLVALHRMKKSGEIDGIAKRLDMLGRQVASSLVVNISDNQSTILTTLRNMYDTQKSHWKQSTEELVHLRDMNSQMLKYLESMERATSSLLQQASESRSAWIWQRDTQVRNLQAVQSKFAAWKFSAEKSNAEEKFLESLWFKNMGLRYSSIADAHAKTFEWIFQPDSGTQSANSLSEIASNPSASQNSFIDWLTRRSGIFWICGKAGSGKSTLMKYLSGHEETKSFLQSWAGEQPLVTASFYFWNAGTDLQKSQEGLLRSLLFEILSRDPGLIPAIFPRQWKASSTNYTLSKLRHWTRSELIEACYRLGQQQMVSLKVCFFVDGLDEYSGDCGELVRLVRNLAQSSENLKFCLSSRPWSVFKNAFKAQNYPRFSLEDLTKDDIRLYVQNKLGDNELFCIFAQKELRCQAFVTQIVEKANGVFLWVFLVVRSLLEGLRNEDRLSDLERRLRIIPADLEKFFRHMLNNIEDAYKDESARAFILALQSKEPLSLMTFSMLDEEKSDYAIDWEIRDMPDKEVNSRHEIMKKRLSSRCKDLLEVHPAVRETTWALHRLRGDATAVGSFRRAQSPAEGFFAYKVDFLHRTVRDFLEGQDIRRLLASRLSTTFSPELLLCQSFLAQIKTIPVNAELLSKHGCFSELVDNMTHYLREIEIREQNLDLQEPLVDELKRVLSQYRQNCSTELEVLFPQSATSHSKSVMTYRHPTEEYNILFQKFTVRKGLRIYLEKQLDNQPNLAESKQMNSLLKHALQLEGSATTICSYSLNTSVGMLQMLLAKGANPLHPTSGSTIFLDFLSTIASDWSQRSEIMQVFQIRAMNTILKKDTRAIQSLLKPNGMVWAVFLLMCPSNWRSGSEVLETLLCETIERLLNNGLEPNTIYRGCTLWGHFVHYISAGDLRRTTKLRLFRTLKEFVRHGADLWFDYQYPLSSYVPYQGRDTHETGTKTSIRQKLHSLYSIDELVDLVAAFPSDPRFYCNSKSDREILARKDLMPPLRDTIVPPSSQPSPSSASWIAWFTESAIVSRVVGALFDNKI